MLQHWNFVSLLIFVFLAILLTCLVDNVLVSLGEVACLSLLGVKLRKDIFSTFFGHV